MSQEVVVVFTAKGINRIVEEGGSSAWRLARNHARRCVYAICTRNAEASWGEGSEPHHAAFLIGKISDVVPCPPTAENNEAPDNRYLIRFSEYARIDIPNFWKGDRNPVKYMALDDTGIDLSKLKWEKMPAPAAADKTGDGAPVKSKTAIRPLTMAKAKKGLALTFNVSPDAIEITIRG